jgi:hypothetical protein
MVDIDNDAIQKEMAEFQNLLDETFQFLDVTNPKLELLKNQSKKALKNLTQIREIQETLNNLESNLHTLEDTSTVLQRELSHLQNLEKISENPSEVTIRAISSMLHLSLRMAITFMPANLLDDSTDPESILAKEMLHERWADWIVELTKYLKQIIPLLVSSLAFESEYSDELSRAYAELKNVLSIEII